MHNNEMGKNVSQTNTQQKERIREGEKGWLISAIMKTNLKIHNDEIEKKTKSKGIHSKKKG